jgi:hypothetical protein
LDVLAGTAGAGKNGEPLHRALMHGDGKWWPESRRSLIDASAFEPVSRKFVDFGAIRICETSRCANQSPQDAKATDGEATSKNSGNAIPRSTTTTGFR